MSKPTKDCTHNELFYCSLCWIGDDFPPNSTMSQQTADALIRGEVPGESEEKE